MRIAKCITPLQIVAMGRDRSVAIGLGWEGDLDQELGRGDDGKPLTIADALGHHLNDHNFAIAPIATRKGPAASPVSKPQAVSQEK